MDAANAAILLSTTPGQALTLVTLLSYSPWPTCKNWRCPRQECKLFWQIYEKISYPTPPDLPIHTDAVKYADNAAVLLPLAYLQVLMLTRCFPTPPGLPWSADAAHTAVGLPLAVEHLGYLVVHRLKYSYQNAGKDGY